MFRLESKTLKREFKIIDGNLYSSQIINTASKMQFIPDGNGSEFFIQFADGDELSSKGLKVIDSAEKDGRLFFRFEEVFGTTVAMTYRVAKDGSTIEKQLIIKQSAPKVIDYIALENIGVINSKTTFTVPEEGTEIDKYYANLGQPFYVDSLFFGCEFPATKNGIFHGRGQVLYYLGKSAESALVCPATIMGGAKSNSILDLKSALFKYIDSISVPSPFRVQYNTWYDKMLNINTDFVQKAFYSMEHYLSSYGIHPLDAYVMDDGWNNYSGDFWSINTKKFPNGLLNTSQTAKSLGGEFGLWLGARGGYNFNRKFAKKIENNGNGYYNSEADDICVASKKYLDKLEDFFVKTTKENDVSYWKLDGFCLYPCLNSSHDHITGGEHNMYVVTEMWQRFIEIFKAIRSVRKKQGKEMWINMTCYAFPSPWWLQYVNSIWLQNSKDIGFSKNYPKDEQAQVDAEITYRDSVYYDFLCKRALQFPVANIYNHEPIYGNEANLDYTDDEFEKFLFWNACRGQALNELYISASMMNEEKWHSLAKVLAWQRLNHHILKNAMLLGGNPADNNIYCYASWTESGEGVIALRNPTNESAALTLTLNKLMGVPESLKDVHRYNVYNLAGKESDEHYNYGDKINMTLKPFEVKILQFGKTDNRIGEYEKVNPFTIKFNHSGADGVVCKNDDIEIIVDDGCLNVKIGELKIESESIINGTNHTVHIVREKNKLVKIYIDNSLDCAKYEEGLKAEISTDGLSGKVEVMGKALPYSEIIKPVSIIKGSRKLFKKEDK